MRFLLDYKPVSRPVSRGSGLRPMTQRSETVQLAKGWQTELPDLDFDSQQIRPRQSQHLAARSYAACILWNRANNGPIPRLRLLDNQLRHRFKIGRASCRERE